MTESAILAKYREIYKPILEHDFTDIDATTNLMRSIGGKVSGLKRKSLQDERLPVLERAIKENGIVPTLNLCARIDEELFNMRSNFQAYKKIFDIKTGRTEKILRHEILKLDNIKVYQKQYEIEETRINDFFKDLRGILKAVFAFKQGKKYDNDMFQVAMKKFPELVV